MSDPVVHKAESRGMSLINDGQSDTMTGHQLQQVYTCILSLILPESQCPFAVMWPSTNIELNYQIHQYCSRHSSHSLTPKTGSS